ncbi:hypothetical protein [Niabella hibiscisoli]|uniref:hypothetical protein n=1 Tax=Niabella hibiscisoli TaxID=1825928 RepID=UPI001F0DAC8E|nr:hypothetical protein [Niabella hibiscisoli]MCH5716276.1 hypothetical protein [Niabella hibiscisoli]
MPQSEVEGLSDLFDDGRKPLKKLSTIRNIGILLCSCIIAGSVLYAVVPKRNGTRDFFGKLLTERELTRNLILGITVSYPVIAFVIGLLVGLLPYRKAAFKDKYVPFSLVTLLVLYLLIIFWVLASLLMS